MRPARVKNRIAVRNNDPSPILTENEITILLSHCEDTYGDWIEIHLKHSATMQYTSSQKYV